MPVAVTWFRPATAIFDIDGVEFLTDAFFSPAGTAYQNSRARVQVDSERQLEFV